MDKKRVVLFDIPIDTYTESETLKKAEEAISSGRTVMHTVVNAGKIVLMQSDSLLAKSVKEADIINADGMAVVWASRILGRPVPERVAGVDLMQELVDLSGKKGYKVFFLGGKEEVVKKVVDIYSAKYGAGIIAGYANGYYRDEDERGIVEKIKNSGANILFVAISSPKKEVFLNKYKDQLKVNFIMGVGGSFDVVAGYIKRAPKWMQDIGLEWFFRFIQEPSRMWKRYLIGNMKFTGLVIKEFFRTKTT